MTEPSEPLQPPLWLRKQRYQAWVKTIASLGFIVRLLEIGRAATAEPFELILEYGVILWTVWSWYSYFQNLRTWREMMADRTDDLRA